MGFWVFMLIMSLLIPITMIGFGGFFRKKSPAKINGFCGYRTPMSMKNTDTWMVAHNYSGKLMWKYGWIMLPISAVAMFFVMGKDEGVVGIFGGILVGLQPFFFIPIIISTERM